MTRALWARLRLRARTTPLAPMGLCSLLLLAALAYLGLDRPTALGLGPGQSRVLSQLAQRWLCPAAALLLLLFGPPAVLEGVYRRIRDGTALLASTAPSAREGGMELLVTAFLLSCLGLVLALPFVWLTELGTMPSGAWSRLLLLLCLAVLLGTFASHLALLGRPGFGRSLARCLLLESGVALLWVWGL